MATNAAVKAANALPEMVLTSKEYTDIARRGLTARSDAAEAETREDLAKKELATLASQLREAEAERGNYIGLFRVTKSPDETEDLAPVGIQFKMSVDKASLKPDDLPVLDELFGAVRPQMWEQTSVVTEITDVQSVIDQLLKAKIDPKTVLEIKVKKGMDGVIAKYTGVTAVDAVVPKAGILARAQESGKHWSAEAKEYFKTYLKESLSPAVTLGGKGKA